MSETIWVELAQVLQSELDRHVIEEGCQVGIGVIEYDSLLAYLFHLDELANALPKTGVVGKVQLQTFVELQGLAGNPQLLRVQHY